MAGQARHRVHAAGLVGRDRRTGAWPARPASGARRRPDRRVARRRLRRHRHRWRRVDARGSTGELVDVSMLEALAMCLTYYPVTFNDQLGRPMRKRRFVPTPGVGAAKRRARRARVRDRTAVARLLRDGRPSRVDRGPEAVPRPNRARRRRSTSGSAQHTVDEVLDLASAFRIPNAPIVNGANAPTFDHFRARGHLRRQPPRRVDQPRPPYRLTPARLRPPEPAPAARRAPDRREPEREPSAAPARPLRRRSSRSAGCASWT